MAQVVCRYRKADEVRWISHLDLKRTLERAMRRADLPLALTQGHNPHPKLSFGPPLPLGATGEAELLTIHLDEPLDPGELKDRLNQQLPPGLEIVQVWGLPRYRRKETFGDIDVAQYRVSVQGPVDPAGLRRRVDELLAHEEIIVERGGERPERTVDIRPLILSLSVVAFGEEEVELRMQLRTGSHGGARPQEVVSLLGLAEDDRPIRYHRVALHAAAQASPTKPKGVGRHWTRSRHSKEGREKK